ncbi:MAG: serine/threonine protein kinase, partial [Nannocystaceae bacterium]
IQTRLSWQEAASVAAQIADGLAAAHALGIVHRDLKPDNILLESKEDGSFHATVLDFGIARIVPESDMTEGQVDPQVLTRVGTVVGTPGYMAPEQATGERVDGRADLYALGVMLWETIAGRQLWTAPTLGEVFAKQFQEDPPPLCGEIGGNVPEHLEDVLRELLSRQSKNRIRDATQIRDALRRIAVGLDPNADEDSLMTARLDPQAGRVGVLSPPTAAHEAWHSPSRRGPFLIGFAVLFVVLATIAGVAVWMGSSNSETPKTPTTATTAGETTDSGSTSATSQSGTEADDTDQTGTTSETATGTASASETDAPPQPAADPVDPEVQKQIDTMMSGSSRSGRARAASKLRKHSPAEAVPEFARASAALTLAKFCYEKRRHYETLRSLKDPRALPLLQRLAKSKRGCGKKKRSDCYSCFRKSLSETVKTLEAAKP